MRIILAAALVMAVGTARAQTSDLPAVYCGNGSLWPLVQDSCVEGANMNGPWTEEMLRLHKDDPFAPPAMRAYTLDEIDRMRRAIRPQVVNDGDCHGKCAHYWEQEEMVELRLRTYMAAGISPEDLERKAKGKN